MQINFYKTDATLIQQVFSNICHFENYLVTFEFEFIGLY